MICKTYARALLHYALLMGLLSVYLAPVAAQVQRSEKLRPERTLHGYHQHVKPNHFDIRRQESVVRQKAPNHK